MTVNTHALVPAASKSGKMAEGATGNQGTGSAREAADAFQSVLNGMGRSDKPVEGGAQQRRQPSGQEQPDRKQAENAAADELGAQADTPARKPAGDAAFSTTNLVDALRKVSHNVLSGPQGQGDEEAGQPLAGTIGAVDAAMLGTASVAIPVNTVLTAGNGRVATAADPGRAPVPGQAQIALPEAAAQQHGARGDASRPGTSSLFAQFGIEPEAVADAAGAGRRSPLPEEAAGTVKILRQETHFAPNMRLSPAQQVGDQITAALKTLSSDAAQAQPGLTHRAEGPVLKTLDIQLTPHELGTVKVSLRMVGDSVEVTLQTSNPQTADLLKQDRQLLDQMLRATVFKADTITIQAADDRASLQAGVTAGGNAANGQSTSGNGAMADGQAQTADRNGSGSDRDQAGRQGREEASTSPETSRGNVHEDDTGNRLSDGLYL